jgi:hypothetical protein
LASRQHVAGRQHLASGQCVPSRQHLAGRQCVPSRQRLVSREAAQECSPRRQPWVVMQQRISPEGAAETIVISEESPAF